MGVKNGQHIFTDSLLSCWHHTTPPCWTSTEATEGFLSMGQHCRTGATRLRGATTL